MYEDNKSPLRRIILIVLAAVAIIAVIWLMAWLLFLRGNDAKKTSTPAKAPSSNSKSTATSPTPTPKTNSSTADKPTPSTSSNPGTPTTPPSSTAATNSGELANTGPGDTVVVGLIAAATGSIFYYSLVRRRLLQ